MNIPIVVLAYGRPNCLERLLQSLKRAKYSAEVRLIISIDGGGDDTVVGKAKEFIWPHGEKEIILHAQNMGLRNHVLFCGGLSKNYDGVIMLEDDIFVAPNFYEYVLHTHSFYKEDRRIAGLALYSHLYNETAKLPFIPIDDGYDVYFMRLACSWGQSWLASQWADFENWYKENSSVDLKNDQGLPPDVCLWPATSWKKYFIKYLIESEKYFVYPRISYSTNFGDPGVHHGGTKTFQVPLTFGQKELRLSNLDESKARYDQFCEIEPSCLNNYATNLEVKDLTIDLYGMKRKSNMKSKYVISRQECSKSIRTYGLELKPHETNIIDNVQGDVLRLAESKHIIPYDNFLTHRLNIYGDRVAVQPYYFGVDESHFYFLNEEIRRLSSNGYKQRFSRLFHVFRKIRDIARAFGDFSK